MASYPGAVKSFTSKNSGDVIQAVDVNDVQDEIAAIEAGLLNGTANLNSSNSTLVNLSVLHNSTLGSTITIGTIPMIFPATGGNAGQVLGISSTSGSTLTLGWQSAAGQIQLLKANSGTDSNASAANVDTIAITGLTAKDVIKVEVALLSVAQATASAALYHNTDSVALLNFSGGVAAGETQGLTLTSQQSQASSTSLVTWSAGRGTAVGAMGTVLVASATTAWTGSWTLALRHGGVTAGGSLQWKWSVLKVLGQ